MNGVVITGPTGAIGMALIKKCIQEGIKVLAICHRGSKRISHIPKSDLVKVIQADLDEYNDLLKDPYANEPKPNTGDYELFIHLAWNGTFGDTRNDTSLQADNIKYTLDAVTLASHLGCKTFVGAGSQAEYGRVNKPLRPDTPTFPENGYGMAKLAAGQLSRIKCEQLGLKHIWTRILSIYGPYDGEYTMVMSTLKKMLSGEETHFTAGDQIWDYLYSEDAADMILHLAESAEHGTICCIGSGQPRPLKEYIKDMYEVTGCTARLGLGDIPYGDKQVMCLYVDKECVIPGCKTKFKDGIRYILDNEEWARSK